MHRLHWSKKEWGGAAVYMKEISFSLTHTRTHTPHAHMHTPVDVASSKNISVLKNLEMSFVGENKSTTLGVKLVLKSYLPILLAV